MSTSCFNSTKVAILTYILSTAAAAKAAAAEAGEGDAVLDYPVDGAASTLNPAVAANIPTGAENVDWNDAGAGAQDWAADSGAQWDAAAPAAEGAAAPKPTSWE